MMEEVFISDEEVEVYEKKSDPARRSVVWSLAAVAAAFVLIGSAYAFGYFGTSGSPAGGFTASLITRGTDAETFPLWSAGGNTNNTNRISNDTNESSIVSSAGCVFESGPSLGSGHATSLIFSEVAWMGTEEGAQYEWLEIAHTNSTNGNANDTNKEVDIGGWSVVDKDEQIQFVFPKNARIPAGGFVLLARGADRVGSMKADYRYTGNLKNEDEGLRLFNEKCEVVDEVLATRPPAGGWPAGDAKTKRTMEKNLATKNWYTSAKAGGTPRAANSLDALQSEASGEHFAEQNVVATSTVSIATTSTPAEEPAVVPATQGVVVISEIMAGKDGAANWDFVELHNLGSGAVNLTGWSVKKRSSTGSESALVAVSRLEGKIIPADGYLLLAHPDYAGTPSADVVWPKSYTLAYTNNAVAMYNANGEKVSEVSWAEIPKGESYAPIGSSFVIGNPTPRTTNN